jgi:response regulator RpfG family c-di-GMP phosphodiesterase
VRDSGAGIAPEHHQHIFNATAPAGHPSEPLTTRSMASILIIDDEVAIATAFAMFFRHDGAHVVTEAYTGGDGIAAYNRLRPDLVLLVDAADGFVGMCNRIDQILPLRREEGVA